MHRLLICYNIINIHTSLPYTHPAYILPSSTSLHDQQRSKHFHIISSIPSDSHSYQLRVELTLHSPSTHMHGSQHIPSHITAHMKPFFFFGDTDNPQLHKYVHASSSTHAHIQREIFAHDQICSCMFCMHDIESDWQL